MPASRSQKRRDALAIEDLAGELMALSLSDLRGLPVQDALKDLLTQGAQLAAHGARKRHLKYVAKNLRSLSADELDALRDHMARRHGSRQAEIHREKYLSSLRDRLLYEETCEEALGELESQFPASDLRGIRELVSMNLKAPRRLYAREIYRILVAFSEREGRRRARTQHE